MNTTKAIACTFLFLIWLINSCIKPNNETDTPDKAIKDPYINEDYDIVQIVGKSEDIYVFNKEGLTNDVVGKICTKRDCYEEFTQIDKIYSNEDFLLENEFDKIGFRRYTEDSPIEILIFYSDLYCDFTKHMDIYNLGGDKDVISVFSYKYDNPHRPFRNENLIIVISIDKSNNYYTDIFAEDCGMHYCGSISLFEKNELYLSYFSNVKSFEDFKQSFPIYDKFCEFKDCSFFNKALKCFHLTGIINDQYYWDLLTGMEKDFGEQ